MPKLSIKAGSTSQSITLFVQDNSVTTGAGLAGIAPAGGSLLTGTKFYYTFPGTGAASVVQSLSVLASVGAAFSAGGIVQIDNTNMVGVVRLDLPNAMLASGNGNSVVGLLFGGTNMAPVPIEIELVSYDPFDAVHLGLSALPNASAGANTGLPVVGTQVPNATAGANNGLPVQGGAIPNAAAEATSGIHSPVVRGGTAQATGNTTSAIKLDSGASATTDAYKGAIIRIMSGTAAGSFGVVNAYNGSTKVATISGTWQTGTPDNTSVFVVLDWALGRIWDELNSGAIHNVQNSAGLQLRNASGGGAIAIRTGTAQSGSTSTTIKLDSGASATNNIYNNMTVVITGGTGLGQTRTIISYNGTTKVATVAGAWVTTPDNTSTFALYAAPTSLVSDQGVAQAGGASSLTLAATASSVNNIYNGSFLTITGGTDAGDTSIITAYNGTTKVATVSPAWAVTPDATSTYAVIPSGATATDSGPTPPSLAEIQSAILSDATPFPGADIDATISSRSTYAGGAVASVTGSVGGDVDGKVLGGGSSTITGTGAQSKLDGSQAVTMRDITGVTAPNIMDALASALAQAGGDWEITAGVLTLLNKDGTTFTTFTLGDFVATPATVPSSRTAE